MMLIDDFGRRITYLRLSVTDRCDLRCNYCMPEGFQSDEEPRDWLTFDELVRLAGLLATMGVERIRITGGEPLLRRNLPDLARRLSSLPGVRDLSLSTNGTQLLKHAESLKQAGIGRLNVSLDSLDRARFQAISRRDVLPEVLAGLEAARKVGFSQIKINMVVMPSTSEDEANAMTAYCVERGFILRLIETMPVGSAGQKAGFVDLRPWMQRIRKRYGLIDGIVSGGGPARYLVSRDGGFQIGFITALSQHFCETCNRIRLGANGSLHLCLGRNDSIDLRTLIRTGASDASIMTTLKNSLKQKPFSHHFGQQGHHVLRMMSSTGG